MLQDKKIITSRVFYQESNSMLHLIYISPALTENRYIFWYFCSKERMASSTFPTTQMENWKKRAYDSFSQVFTQVPGPGQVHY